jgi:hypothetical protein
MASLPAAPTGEDRARAWTSWSVAVIAAIATATGCYAPSPVDGLPCGAGGRCPTGQRCDFDNVCRRDPIDPLPDARSDATSSDADPQTPDATPLWVATPVPNISTPTSVDDDPTVTDDALEMYFVSDRPGGPGGDDIWKSTRATTVDPWGAPSPVLELSSTAVESSPDVSGDGLAMYLVSSRGGARQIHKSTRPDRATAWSVPMVVAALDPAGTEYNVTVRDDTAVVDRQVSGGTRDLYLTTRPPATDAWAPMAAITNVNTSDVEGGATITGGLLTIYFHRYLPTRDVWTASRTDTATPFGPPTKVDELDVGDEGDAYISPDGDTLWFERDGDIYVATRP